MAAIDQIIAHYQDLPLRSQKVPEWGKDGKPLVIHWKPWTLFEKRKLYNAVDQNDISRLADAICMKALDEAGDAMFTLEDKHTIIRKGHDAIVQRVAMVILADLAPDTDEDLEGN